jgi:transcriptional regulator with XRE-family HTH domain
MSKLENRTKRTAVPLEHVIGQRTRTIREREGLTQDELAADVRRQGLNWSRSAIASLEGGMKALSLVEVAVLVMTLRQYEPRLTFVDIVTSPHAIRVGDSQKGGDYVAWVIEQRFSETESSDALGIPEKYRVQDYRLIMPKARATDIARAERDAKGDAELRTGRRLHVDATWVALAALRVWGHSLSEERDIRVAAGPDGDRRALRGHVTRQLTDELAPILEDAKCNQDLAFAENAAAAIEEAE